MDNAETSEDGFPTERHAPGPGGLFDSAPLCGRRDGARLVMTQISQDVTCVACRSALLEVGR